MSHKVLLIYPPTSLYNREDRCQVPSRNVVVAPPLPPTDLLYMASMAERAGAAARIMDYTIDARTTDDLLKDIKEFDPDMLVISTTTPTLEQDLELCSPVKKASPSIRIIAKGAHFLKFDEAVLTQFQDLDMVIRGEPEETLLEVVSDRDRGKITGLTYRDGKEIKRNADRVYSRDLDGMPFPARHLIDNRRYVRPDNGKPQAVIKVARGCPYNCFFCLATPVSGKELRLRTPENIVLEIKECVEKYNIRDFLFWADTFNINKKWVEALCSRLIDEDIGIRWAANTRVDTMDLETALLMKRAGCHLVSMGIESGNQEILDKIGKKIDLKTIKNAFAILKKAGIKTFAYYIIGFPWDTERTITDTIELSIELDSDYANFFTATAFPGTQFFDYAVQHSLLPGFDPLNFRGAYYFPSAKGHHLSKEEIFRWQKEAVKRFFLRPRYIMKTLLSIRSLKEFLNLANAGLSLIGKI